MPSVRPSSPVLPAHSNSPSHSSSSYSSSYSVGPVEVVHAAADLSCSQEDKEVTTAVVQSDGLSPPELAESEESKEAEVILEVKPDGGMDESPQPDAIEGDSISYSFLGVSLL